MTNETNVAILACKKAGAEEVFIADSHWASKNLLQDKLHTKFAEVVPRDDSMMMLSGVKGCDVVIFLGYHGKAGGDNFLAHTLSGEWIEKVTVNDVEVSEGTLNAAVARDLGAKLVFVAGTDVGVEEVLEENPSVHSIVATKSDGEWSGIPA